MADFFLSGRKSIFNVLFFIDDEGAFRVALVVLPSAALPTLSDGDRVTERRESTYLRRLRFSLCCTEQTIQEFGFNGAWEVGREL